MATPSPEALMRSMESDDLLDIASEVEKFAETPAYRFIQGLAESERRRTHERIESGLRSESEYAAAAAFAKGLAYHGVLIELIRSEARRAEQEAALSGVEA